jgi:hypothetical protein
LSSWLLSEKIKIEVYITIILSVVLYGCEIRCHIKGRTQVFENRVLRRIFGCRRYEVTGGWRELHVRSSVIHTLYHILLE